MNNESAKSTWEDDLTGVEEVSQRQRDWDKVDGKIQRVDSGQGEAH